MLCHCIIHPPFLSLFLFSPFTAHLALGEFIKRIRQKDSPSIDRTLLNISRWKCVFVWISITHTHTVKIQIYAPDTIGSDTQRLSDLFECHILFIYVMTCHIFEMYPYGNRTAAQ